jgi:hypothetical protein
MPAPQESAGRWAEAPPLEPWVVEEVVALIGEELLELRKIIKSLSSMVDSSPSKKAEVKPH